VTSQDADQIIPKEMKGGVIEDGKMIMGETGETQEIGVTSGIDPERVLTDTEKDLGSTLEERMMGIDIAIEKETTRGIVRAGIQIR